jgi:hypothetical protein
MGFIPKSAPYLLYCPELVIKFNQAGNKTQPSALSPANAWLMNIVITPQ